MSWFGGKQCPQSHTPVGCSQVQFDNLEQMLMCCARPCVQRVALEMLLLLACRNTPNGSRSGRLQPCELLPSSLSHTTPTKHRTQNRVVLCRQHCSTSEMGCWVWVGFLASRTRQCCQCSDVWNNVATLLQDHTRSMQRV